MAKTVTVNFQLSDWQKKLEKFIRKYEWLVVGLVLLAGAVVRLYNFEYRINFGPEQADSLLTAANQLRDGISLLGQDYFARKTSFGHQLFASPLFTYSLFPLLKIFRYDPQWVTGYFAGLNLLTAGLFYWLAKKMTGILPALLALGLFLFDSYIVYHSMFIWILNYLPLVGVLTIWAIYKIWPSGNERQKLIWYLVLGALTGIGVGLEYLYLITGLVVMGVVIWRSHNRVLGLLCFFGGMGLANLPTLLFEVRNDWYHTRTLWQYVIDTMNSPGQSAITYYHFLQWHPLLAVAGSLLLLRISVSKWLFLGLALVFYLWFNMNSPLLSWSSAVGMSEDWDYPRLKAAAEEIVGRQPTDFNVASLVSSDTLRAYPLRYLLTYRYGRDPQSVTDYPRSQVLYLVATDNYFDQSEFPWEVQSIQPFKITWTHDLPGRYKVYELGREED